MSLLDDLGAYLSTQGVATVGTDLFLGTLPATPDAVTALFESPAALPPIRAMTSNAGAPVLERPRVQAQTRALTYVAAKARAIAVRNALDWQGPVTIGGTRYACITALQPPFPLRVDDNDRPVFALNLEVWAAESS